MPRGQRGQRWLSRRYRPLSEQRNPETLYVNLRKRLQTLKRK
jgi:hypothetical protein